eukprot:4930241-Pleurochrysis_carterae.AAC.11
MSVRLESAQALPAERSSQSGPCICVYHGQEHSSLSHTTAAPSQSESILQSSPMAIRTTICSRQLPSFFAMFLSQLVFKWGTLCEK